jgi:hypothetical protein
MGCDIHLNYEIKTVDGWKFHDWQAKYQTGTYHDGERMIDWNNAFDDVLCSGRNYYLFAFLANVRNHYIYVDPISKPRGLPDDVTADVKQLSDSYGEDGHSHSWLTLAELIEFDYSRKVNSDGDCINTYEDVLGIWWFQLLTYLNETFGVDNVRLVFWFDN